jgi:hypothetical protein
MIFILSSTTYYVRFEIRVTANILFAVLGQILNLPLYAGTASVIILVLRLLGTKFHVAFFETGPKDSVEAASVNMASENGAEQGGTIIFAFHFTRPVGCLALFGLEISSLRSDNQRSPNSHTFTSERPHPIMRILYARKFLEEISNTPLIRHL